VDTGAPDATAVHSLLQNPNARDHELSSGGGFTILFPELVRLVLPQGVIDIDRNIPPHDVPLIGSTAKVLVRSELHPEIVQLLLQPWWKRTVLVQFFSAAVNSHTAPTPNIPLPPAATDFYKNGPSYMQRHVPLWLSVHVQRALAVLVTAIAIGFPLVRLMPVAYTWINRRRLFYWYAQLKALEASFDTDPTDKHLTRKQAEIERIEDAVTISNFR